MNHRASVISTITCNVAYRETIASKGRKNDFSHQIAHWSPRQPRTEMFAKEIWRACSLLSTWGIGGRKTMNNRISPLSEADQCNFWVALSSYWRLQASVVVVVSRCSNWTNETIGTSLWLNQIDVNYAFLIVSTLVPRKSSCESNARRNHHRNYDEN